MSDPPTLVQTCSSDDLPRLQNLAQHGNVGDIYGGAVDNVRH